MPTSSGAPVAFLAEGVRRHADGTLAGLTLTFRAQQVPAVGYRTYQVTPAAAGRGRPAAGAGRRQAGRRPPGWRSRTTRSWPKPTRPNGGTLRRILDKRTGTELLRGPGNELVLQEEYDYHPKWAEGPWLLSPKGPGTGSAGRPATVRAERCPAGARLVAEFALGDLRVTQETVLWDGAQRVEFRTQVDGSIGSDRLLRVRFPARVPGALPVYQTALSVIGRPFGHADADVAEHWYTLDNPAHEWFGLSSAARIAADRARRAHADRSDRRRRGDMPADC